MDPVTIPSVSQSRFFDCETPTLIPPIPDYESNAREVATRLYSDAELEFDDNAVVHKNDDGAFVQCWRWVSNRELGWCNKCGTKHPTTDDDDSALLSTDACRGSGYHLTCRDRSDFCNRCGDDALFATQDETLNALSDIAKELKAPDGSEPRSNERLRQLSELIVYCVRSL